MSETFYVSCFRKGDFLYLRGYENGLRVKKKIKYEPYLFVPSKKDDTEYKTLEGSPVEKIKFDSIYEMSEFQKRYKEVEGFNFYGMTDPVYAFLNDYYKKELEVSLERLNCVYLDIEVSGDGGFSQPGDAWQPVTAISLKKKDLILAFGCKEFNPTQYEETKKVIYIKCKNEESLLLKFLDCWNQLDIDIVSGWHISGFDIPYLYNRIARIHGAEFARKLSPWEMVEVKTVEVFGKEQEFFYPKGIVILDYLDLYKRFSYTPQESYTLNHICYSELGEKKLDYSEFENLQDLYNKDFPLYMQYNIRDSVLVSKLEDKMGLISLVLTQAYTGKFLPEDAFATVKPWDAIIHSELLAKKIVIPQYERKQHRDFAGGFVKETIPGKYSWVVSVDFEQLYPSLIIQYNMSPETLVGSWEEEFTVEDVLNGYYKKVTEELKEKNLTLTANGILWDRSKLGFIPEILIKKKKKRKEYKKGQLEAELENEKNSSRQAEAKISLYKNKSQAEKIQSNAFYGSLASPWSRWFDIRYAEAITLTGQAVVQYVQRKLNEWLSSLSGIERDYTIASDTDSAYFYLDDFGSTFDEINDFIKEKLEPKIKDLIEEFSLDSNCFQLELKMEREAIADRGIFVAKKNYAINLLDNKGVRYEKPKLKLVGLAAAKVSTPEPCRKAIKEAIGIILYEDQEEVISFIDNYRDKFYNMEIQDICLTKGSDGGLTKYGNPKTLYSKGTPLHVRGALAYNNLLREKKLENTYSLVRDGDKIKYCYLTLPNPLKENVVGFTGMLPRELNIQSYIDFELQFEKAFLDPLKSILDAIGWTVEKINTLEGVLF